MAADIWPTIAIVTGRGTLPSAMMRFCPLARVEIPCSEAAPLCPWCELKAQATTPKRDGICEQAPYQGSAANNQLVQPSPIAVVTLRTQRRCIHCGIGYIPSGNHQQRCEGCAAEHNRMKNRAYQAGFRQRQRERAQA
jgi:hypothetical protein